MSLIPLLLLVIGFLVGLQLRVPVPEWLQGYLGLAVVGGIDTVLGGIRSSLEGKFSSDIFITGFIGNILLGCLLAWLGDNMGMNLFLVVAVVFGWRAFTNLSLIRRILLTRWHDAQHRARQEAERKKQAAPTQAAP
jgi:small basic protein